MIKKYSIMIGIIISISLLVISTWYYPGGSQYDKNSIGYDWKNNYLCNLFGEKAMNGLENGSRFWAICGMMFLCISAIIFFIEFSKKIPSKSSAAIIKYCGAGAMLFEFLAVTPLHDTAITIGGTLALLSMFYITVFVFSSKLHLFKVLSVLCLLAIYCGNYIYYTGNLLEFLPIVQKIALAITITWILSLHYFTTVNDFKSRKAMALKIDDMATNH